MTAVLVTGGSSGIGLAATRPGRRRAGPAAMDTAIRRASPEDLARLLRGFVAGLTDGSTPGTAR